MTELMEKATKAILDNSKYALDGIGRKGISAKFFAEIKGVKYMIKGENNKETMLEVVLYKLGRELGLNVLPVFYVENKFPEHISSRVDICSVHKLSEDFQSYNDLEDQVDYINKVYKDDILRMRAFDAITSNEDRHGGNWGLVNGLDGQIAMIDHGLSCVLKYSRGKIEIEDIFNTEMYNFRMRYHFRKRTQAVLDLVSDFVSIEEAKIWSWIQEFEKYQEQKCEMLLKSILNCQKFYKEKLEEIAAEGVETECQQAV